MKAELASQKKRNFFKDCQAIIVAILQKVQERCPLKYDIVYYAASLSPSQIIRCKEKCNDGFWKLVDKLYGGHWISPKAADLAKKDFDSLLKSVHTELKDTFLTFDQKKEPVHSFFAGIKPEWASYKNRWKIFKLVFTLSHGQVSVERGFSINKELLVEKLHDLSFLRGWFTIMLTVLESQWPRFLSPVLCWKVVNWLIQGMP